MQMTQSFSPSKKRFKSLEILGKDVKKLVNYFDCNSLRLNADKTEFIVFGFTESKDISVTNDGQKIKEKTEVKYLGVTIDKKTHLSIRGKIFFRSMAEDIKSIYTLRNCVPESIKKTLINSIVISHLQYQAVLQCSLSQNLTTTLEKQLNWAVKAGYNRKKVDSSDDLKLMNHTLPVRMFIQYRVALYTRQIFNYKKQAIKNNSCIPLPTANFYFHNRTR